MRRGGPVLAALALCLLLAGCGGGRQDAGDWYVLYFPVRDYHDAVGDGALRTEASAVPLGTDPREASASLLAALLEGPADEALQSPFPGGTALRSLDLQGSRAVVDLSAEYGSLSGVALTLADYAVALTLTQIPEISVVRITVQGQELAYRDRQFFTGRDVLLDPEGDVVGTVEALLYFPDGEGVLTEEARSLPLYEGNTQVETVTEALEGGPENRDLLPVFPDGFRVRAVWQEENLCFVNLSSALLDGVADSPALPRALRALDLSLCSLENVRAVRYLVDGEFVRSYGGVSLEEPYYEAAL